MLLLAWGVTVSISLAFLFVSLYYSKKMSTALDSATNVLDPIWNNEFEWFKSQSQAWQLRGWGALIVSWVFLIADAVI